jgi:hypothetical protein
MKQFLWLFALMISTLSAYSQQSPAAKPTDTPARAEVLVLGVFHMNNPGHDLMNMQVDDVLAPKRQAEIAQVVAALKEFHPTKIAVEADVDEKKVPNAYADYLAGKHELTRNEIEQLGFRLAKELGHKEIYPVDTDGDFPYQRLANYAKGSGRSKEFAKIGADWTDAFKEENSYLPTHTVLQMLLLMNSDQRAAADQGFYYQWAQLGEPGDWAGADLLADWFRRNIRIYSNVMQLVDSPNERILVIFGAGHLGWLRYDFASNPTLRLRKLAEFAK